MKNYWRFKINKDSNTFIENEEQFKKELAEINGEIWYFSPHFFNEEWKQTAFWGTIISLKKLDEKDLERIKDTYWIEPAQIVSDVKKSEYHLFFDYNIGIKVEEHRILEKALAKIYRWEAVKEMFYNWNKDFSAIIKQDWPFLLDDMKTLRIFSWITSDTSIEQQFTKDELKMINEINEQKIENIAKKMWKTEDKFDTVLNISPKFWRTYNYILNNFNTPTDAKKWMNENIWTKFIERKDISKYINDWLAIEEWEWFWKDSLWYFTYDKNWWRIRETDFFINVHYKIKKSDKEFVYVVTLINEAHWDKSNKIEWSNSLGRIPFSEFVQKLWNFHYTWDGETINFLHKRISQCKEIPSIITVIWYGFHEKEWVAIFENGIFDLKEKIFTPKEDMDEEFFFNYNGKWYIVTDNQWNYITKTFKWLIPNLIWQSLIWVDDLFDIFWRLYNDYSGMLAVIITLGSMWYSLYAKKWTDDTLPFLFLRWVTGSWKSSYMRLMQRMWWINSPSKAFSDTTNFMFSVLLSYLVYCPIFFSEYRENGKENPQKVWVLRVAYDKASGSRWRADQTVVNYDYRALPMIDWQEMIQDAATRTRCIQLRFLKSHKVTTNFSAISQEAYPILDNTLYSYLMLSKWDKYQEYLKEWFEIFSNTSKESSRIWANLKIIYAGCMAFDPSHKDDYIDVLKRTGEFQDKDVKANSDYAQIIKAISKFLSQDFWVENSVHIVQDSIAITWSTLEDYIKKVGIELTLKTDSYKDNLEENWFKIDFINVWDRMPECLIMKFEDVPKQFLVCPKICIATTKTRNNLSLKV